MCVNKSKFTLQHWIWWRCLSTITSLPGADFFKDNAISLIWFSRSWFLIAEKVVEILINSLFICYKWPITQFKFVLRNFNFILVSQIPKTFNRCQFHESPKHSTDVSFSNPQNIQPMSVSRIPKTFNRCQFHEYPKHSTDVSFSTFKIIDFTLWHMTIQWTKLRFGC